MKTEKIYLDAEFEKFWNKIEHNENFALLRYADGERAIMMARAIDGIDGWKSPDKLTDLGKSLINNLSFTDENVYYGISCPCCDLESYYWIKTRLKTKNITFSNLFVNGNYLEFISRFKNLSRDAIVIANKNAENKPFGNLNILKYYSVSDDCFSFWDNNVSDMIAQIKKDFGERNDLLYIISAGPMSEPIIGELYQNNPNNCYIDFGCAVNEFIHGYQNRPFIDANHPSAKQNCWMYNPQATDFDVSVILTLYKRPENLEKQLEAIENQSLKPKEILLFQDGIDYNYKIELSDELKSRFNLIEISDKNQGVWARFKFAQRAKSQYVCIFDDDTIPGTRWLENCHKNMMEQEGLYGTIGILMEKPEEYAYSGHFRVGWDGPLDSTTEVDLIGHSWFFKKDWVNYLFDGTEEFQKLKTAAEDMTFSAQLQKQGIKTFVPPHPPNDTKLWGSLPEYAIKLGQSSCALSFTGSNHEKMNWAVNKHLQDGWQTLIKTQPKYVSEIKELLNKKEKFRFFGKTKDGNNRTLRIFGIKIKWKKKK